jgi:hypothetical protein
VCTVGSPGAYAISSGLIDAYNKVKVAEALRLYFEVPRAAGGPVPMCDGNRERSSVQSHMLRAEEVDTTPGPVTILDPCEDVDCGGPEYCLHRLVPDIDPQVARDWRVFALPVPLQPPHAHLSLATYLVTDMLNQRLGPDSLRRCGATPAVLATLGFRLRDLVEGWEYQLYDLVNDLRLKWVDMEALGFDPLMLRDKEHYHITDLVRAGLTKYHLCSYGLTWRQMRIDMKMTLEELVVLEFTAADLFALGMDGVQAMVLVQETLLKRTMEWHAKVLQWTLPLFASMTVSTSAFRKVDIAPLVAELGDAILAL